MEKYTLLIPVIALLLFSNCVSNNYSKMLCDTNEECIKRNYKKDLKHYHSLKEYGRNDFVLNILDSLINKIVLENGYDTIYLFENYGPPMYGYYSFLWSKKYQYKYCFSRYHCEELVYVPDDIIGYIPLIDKWNEKEIQKMYHKKPLSWNSTGKKREVVANRMIFKDKKCIIVESIIFGEIDFFREEKLMRYKKGR